jgi:Domain of unknown function (DUF5916)/Carbohydrate family 9 binding domain-like
LKQIFVLLRLTKVYFPVLLSFIVKKFTAFLLFIIFIIPAFAQTAANKIVVPPEKSVPISIPKFDISPIIDGNIDDEVWKKAAVFKDFIQIRPGDNIPPSKQTIAYAGYDEKNLYFAFNCFDEPDKIRATLAKRDDLFSDDNVRVTLDTFNDQRRAYVLFFNPFGVQADGITTAETQGMPDLSVDIVMESKAVITADGWTVEVKIPFKSLRFDYGKGKKWGFNVARKISRFNDENDSWMPIERGITPLSQIGKIEGLDDIKIERNLEIVPSITVSESAERIKDLREPIGSRLLNRPIKQDIGLSIKYQITPNVTLDAAVNPDFAEVEADAPVVRANERFPIFFPEKRPFFLEGNDYFRTPLQVVNTRNIADPDVALKLTGKSGKNTFGIFTAVDRFPNTKTKAYIGVLRLKHDIGTQSNIGLIATTYHFGARKHNNLFGFDGKLQVNKQANFNFQVVGTKSNRDFFNSNRNVSEYRSGNGIAYQANYDYTGRNRGYLFGINGRSRDYRADVGFTRRTNTHGVSAGFRIGTQPNAKKTLIGLTTRTFFGYNIDEKGRLQETKATFQTEWNLQKQLRFSSESGVGVEKIYEDEFRNAKQLLPFYGKDFRGALQFWSFGTANKTFNKRLSVQSRFGFIKNDLDFDAGAGERFLRVSPAALLGNSRRDPGKGLNIQYSLGLGLQPTDPLSIDLSYNRSKLTRNDTKLTAFDSNIFSLRSTYQITRFTFVRARADYETLDGSLNSQLLFGWSPNPGTAFYVGYNDNSNYKSYNDYLNKFDDGFRRDGRRFFIRASYLFRRSF